MAKPGKKTAGKRAPRGKRATGIASRKKVAGAPATAGGVLRQIRDEAAGIRRKILARRAPAMKFPLRSLANVVYRPAAGYLQMKGRKKERALTVGTVKTFA